LTILFAVLRSIGTSATLAFAGIIVTRTGLITDHGRRCLAELSMNLMMPLQLFTAMVAVRDKYSFTPLSELIKGSWILLLLPLLVVGSGMALGKLVAVVTGCPQNFSKACVGAVAFANSTGMSITLLQVLAPALLQEGIIDTDPLKYLPVYLLLYPMLQWTVGSYLFGLLGSGSNKEQEQKKQQVAELPVAQTLGHQQSPEATGATAHRVTFMLPEPEQRDTEEAQHSTVVGTSSCDSRASAASQANAVMARSSTLAFAHVASTAFARALSVGVDQLPELHLAADPDFYPPEMMHAASFCSQAPARAEDLEAPSEVNTEDSFREQESESGPSACRRCMEAAAKVIRNALVPPVVGSALGLLFAFFTPVQALFVELPGSTAAAPLGFLFAGLAAIGHASVPLNMLVLGSNLSKGCDFKALPIATNLGILFMKNLGQPAMMAGAIFILSRIFTGTAVTVWFVAMIVSCTPTANNIMVMVELSGQNKAGVTTCIFTQYIAAPFVLTFVVTVFLLYKDVLVPSQ